jgi:hypothetical protein
VEITRTQIFFLLLYLFVLLLCAALLMIANFLNPTVRASFFLYRQMDSRLFWARCWALSPLCWVAKADEHADFTPLSRRWGQVRWLLDKCDWGAAVAGALRVAKSLSISSRIALS